MCLYMHGIRAQLRRPTMKPGGVTSNNLLMHFGGAAGDARGWGVVGIKLLPFVGAAHVMCISRLYIGEHHASASLDTNINLKRISPHAPAALRLAVPRG